MNNIYQLPNGLQVRVIRDKKEHNQTFFYRNYESKAEAREDAEKYRDKLLDELPEPDRKHNYEKTPYYPTPTNKSTGVSGVYRTIKTEKDGSKNAYYGATVKFSRDDARTISRSINKHGEVGAFVQCVNFRIRGLTEVYGDRFSYSTFIKDVEKYIRKIQKEPIGED